MVQAFDVGGVAAAVVGCDADVRVWGEAGGGGLGGWEAQAAVVDAQGGPGGVDGGGGGGVDVEGWVEEGAVEEGGDGG